MEPKTRKVRRDKGQKRAHYKPRAKGVKRGPYKKQLETRIKISYRYFLSEGEKLVNLNLINKSKYDYYANESTGFKNYIRDYINQMNNPLVAVDGDRMTLQQKKNSRNNINVNYVIGRDGKIKIDENTGEFLTRQERILVPMHKFFLKNVSIDGMLESQRKYYNKLINANASQQLKNYDLTNVDPNSQLYQNITNFKELSDFFDELKNSNGMYAYNGGIIVKEMMDSGFTQLEAIAEAHARGFNS